MSYYLLDHDNPHAVGGFHGYASRRAEVRMVVLHTTESVWDLAGRDTGAERVAEYMSGMDRPASYHTIVDRDSIVPQLPYSYTSFGVRGYNSVSINIAVAGQAHRWPELTDTQVTAIMDNLADEVREALDWAGLPAVRLTAEEARGGGRGIATHAQLDPARRSDPGKRFPWKMLLARLDAGDAMSEGPKPPRDWADRVWRDYCEKTGTDSSTRTWNFWREDVSWLWDREIRPLEDRVSALEARVKQLEDK